MDTVQWTCAFGRLVALASSVTNATAAYMRRQAEVWQDSMCLWHAKSSEALQVRGLSRLQTDPFCR